MGTVHARVRGPVILGCVASGRQARGETFGVLPGFPWCGGGEAGREPGQGQPSAGSRPPRPSEGDRKGFALGPRVSGTAAVAASLAVDPADCIHGKCRPNEGEFRVVVQHVHFDGLGRTKDDIIMYEIGDVFKAKNLIDVMRKSHEAREKLLRLGIFRQVDVLIDTCQGDDALPNGLDVTFEVTELRRLTGSYNTMVGNNEGSMVLGLKLPNLLGRAEKVTFQFSYGTKETSYGLSFFKPQPGNFERNFSVNLYKVTGQFPWSSLRETDRGLSAEYSFPIWKTSHTVKWEGVWRELGCLSRTASFAVRKESGHSLKSSLSHAMVIDSRNSSILPKRGALLKINQELAGYTGGDVSFLKEDFELQLNKQLMLDSVISASLWGGMLVPIGDKPSSIADRFILRGPESSLVSPVALFCSDPGDYLGGEAYWAGGLHLYTPLPFRPGQGGFGELFRTHFFLNAGNLCNLNYGEGPKAHIRRLAECIRWSYGAGIVLRLGNIARLELNYCIPMGVQKGDSFRLSCFSFHKWQDGLGTRRRAELRSQSQGHSPSSRHREHVPCTPGLSPFPVILRREDVLSSR
ncbi:sorting and assembly machinery component 50 homolog [Orycteropus afer afer]|uniref:Sorting and assembly machinery component 50 homolog n=1 Tax=Orycteropus afer afer TaxID=1230840 RepID=A0A8B6ZXZ5_ORYAF|nr:sorting and assembly machinery component 50 homolog [Orycteropus afer afer]